MNEREPADPERDDERQVGAVERGGRVASAISISPNNAPAQRTLCELLRFDSHPCRGVPGVTLTSGQRDVAQPG